MMFYDSFDSNSLCVIIGFYFKRREEIILGQCNVHVVMDNFLGFWLFMTNYICLHPVVLVNWQLGESKVGGRSST